MAPLPNIQAIRNRHASAFSLIELLAVMAIISILLVAAVPIFSDSSNNARRTSSETLKAHLRQARAHAIASGTPTAVAIPTLTTGTDIGARAITLFEVEKDGTDYVVSTALNDDGTPGQPQLQRWTILPGNFHFLPSSLISSSKGTIMDSPDRLATDDGDCHYIVFSPSGRIIRPLPGDAVRIAFAQAGRNGDSLTLTQRSGGEPVFEFIEVSRLTGRTRRIDR